MGFCCMSNPEAYRRRYLPRDEVPERCAVPPERVGVERDVLLCTLGVLCERVVRTCVLCGVRFTVVRVELGRL